MTLHIWVKIWLTPPTSIRKPDHLPAQLKPSLILLFLLLPPYSALWSSLSAPWAPDERLREMAVLLVISAPGHSHYICRPAGLYARQSPGPRMGRSRGGLVLPGLEENTSTKSPTHPPNPVSLTVDWIIGLYIAIMFSDLQPSTFYSHVSCTYVLLLPLAL